MYDSPTQAQRCENGESISLTSKNMVLPMAAPDARLSCEAHRTEPDTPRHAENDCDHSLRSPRKAEPESAELVNELSMLHSLMIQSSKEEQRLPQAQPPQAIEHLRSSRVEADPQ